MRLHRLVMAVVLCVCFVAAEARAQETIRLFFLAGQSNMQGHGKIEVGNGGVVGGIGSLRYQVNNDPAKYGHLGDGAGNWNTRSDVWVWNRNGTDTGKTTGDLGVTYGVDSTKIGPEVGFGKVVGDAFDDQVVLVKTAWGGKSLFADFRPPTAVANRGGTVGPYYTIMLDSMNEALGDVAAQFPTATIQIEGLGWHQGFNDRLNTAAVAEYEENMNDLIADLRSELSAPGMKVVIGTTSTGSAANFDPANYTTNPGNVANRIQDHVQAQKNVGLFDPFASTVDTRPFWREAGVSPANQGFHWNQNGETMYLIGEGMGEAMVGLVPEPSSLALLGIAGLSLMRRRSRA